MPPRKCQDVSAGQGRQSQEPEEGRPCHPQTSANSYSRAGQWGRSQAPEGLSGCRGSKMKASQLCDYQQGSSRVFAAAWLQGELGRRRARRMPGNHASGSVKHPLLLICLCLTAESRNPREGAGHASSLILQMRDLKGVRGAALSPPSLGCADSPAPLTECPKHSRQYPA